MNTSVTAERADAATDEGPVAVRVEGLGKQYRTRFRGRKQALRDCAFELPAGRVAALVGSNGAGKTTLLSVLAGLLGPTEGRAQVGALDVRELRSTKAGPAERVAFMAQEKPLYRHFTAADMLRFGAHLNRLWDQQRALDWLARFEIPLDQPCGKLSGGQQTQVAFAVAMGSRPSVLLLDEPLANLDPLVRREVAQELLAEVNDTGMTVILSTHMVNELGGLADYLLLLSKGRLLVDGDIDTLLENHLHYVGPRSDTPPGPGHVVRAKHTDRQSSFLVRLSGTAAPKPEAPWTTRPVTLEDLVLAHLAGDKEKAA